MRPQQGIEMKTGDERSSREPGVDQAADDADQARRDALLRLAHYPAPALLALLLSNQAPVAS